MSESKYDIEARMTAGGRTAREIAAELQARGFDVGERWVSAQRRKRNRAAPKAAKPAMQQAKPAPATILPGIPDDVLARLTGAAEAAADPAAQCTRCGGAGKLRGFSHVEGGTCFACHGRGVRRVRGK